MGFTVCPCLSRAGEGGPRRCLFYRSGTWTIESKWTTILKKIQTHTHWNWIHSKASLWQQQEFVVALPNWATAIRQLSLIAWAKAENEKHFCNQLIWLQQIDSLLRTAFLRAWGVGYTRIRIDKVRQTKFVFYKSRWLYEVEKFNLV